VEGKPENIYLCPCLLKVISKPRNKPYFPKMGKPGHIVSCSPGRISQKYRHTRKHCSQPCFLKVRNDHWTIDRMCPSRVSQRWKHHFLAIFSKDEQTRKTMRLLSRTPTRLEILLVDHVHIEMRTTLRREERYIYL
jgi:hypothetical protein